MYHKSLSFLIFCSLSLVNSAEVENICDSDVCAQVCEPTENSFRCSCFKGYILMEDGISCKPQKRALKKGGRCEQNNPCDHDCTDTGTAIKCSCRQGYELGPDDRTCKDIDECAMNIHECTAAEECINEVGSYSCYDSSDVLGENEDTDFDKKCPPGYKFDLEKGTCDDINECQFELMCVPPKSCKNTIGSFICEEDTPQCPPGFYYKTETKHCEDIDECKGDQQLCKENEKCVNQPGGYTCINITTTTEAPSTTTKPTTTTTTTERHPVKCPVGYKFVEERYACEDINECSTGLHNCDVAERCDNTIGSYHCSRIYGCGTGYTLNLHNGLCEDDDECQLGTHNCNNLGSNFRCRNIAGSYRCEPIRSRPLDNTSSVIPTKPTTKMMTDNSTPTTISATTSASTTFKVYSQPSSFKPLPYPQVPSRPVYPQYLPPTPLPLPPRPYQPTSLVTPRRPVYPQYTPPTHPTTTESSAQTFPSIVFQPPPSTPSVLPKYVPRQSVPVPIPSRPVVPYPATPYYNVITGQSVISGQLKKCLRGYTMNIKGECEDINECDSNPCSKHEKCINFNGGFQCAPPIIQCKRGMELNEAGDQCIDINECTRNLHKCNPSQICKNYPGYYTCECPPGHHLKSDRCEDIDECKIFRPCGTYANCINTKGSYKCECKEGFRETNNSCEDIDECAANIGLCEHKCVNTWGSYRCSCSPGFTLNADNRTCTDVDECERFKDKRLCIGTCVNVPGSYKCQCPKGYKLGSDNRVCLDIDECEQNNVCLSEEVCLNTRGSFKCYSIKCPENYVKDVEHKARCKRIQTACDPREWNCQLMPEQYTYQYITLVSNLPLTHGKIQLFQIKGPQWNFTRAEFSMKLLDVICPYGVDKVNDLYFHKMADQHTMSLYLVRSIQGPQEIKLQIEMRLYKGNTVLGNAVVYIIIVVSEYPF